MSGVIPKDGRSLLTISRSDLDTSIPSHNHDLVLFQLPDQMDWRDLLHSRIVASTPTQQACWIHEDKGVSYAVTRVETSNAYVLIRPDKRPRLHVQLLQRGGSGSSFLELTERALDVSAMQAMLEQHVFDPFDATACREWKGLSVEELAVPLQVSEKQVVAGLMQLQAFCLNNRYGLLSEEGLAEAQTSIVATLTEVERFHDLVDLDVEDCIRQVVARSEEPHDSLPDVIRHTLHTLQSDGDASKVSLDVTKVAQCLAHRLFRKQGTWDTTHLLSEWQLQMPGVTHQVNVNMLEGLAVSLPNDKWMYAANMTLRERLERLFAIKEGWSEAELAPHVRGDEGWTKYCKLVTSPDGKLLYHFNNGEV